MLTEYEKLLQQAKMEDVCREEKLPKFESIKVPYMEYKLFETLTKIKRKMRRGKL